MRGLCRMTNTERETLAFVQGVKVDNNPSITKKNVMGESEMTTDGQVLILHVL